MEYKQEQLKIDIIARIELCEEYGSISDELYAFIMGKVEAYRMVFETSENRTTSNAMKDRLHDIPLEK